MNTEGKMAHDINIRFTTKDGEYPGAYLRDYFSDDGYRRALNAQTEFEAYKILAATYIGPDVDGIGVIWW
jgi:hypothetical protein